MAYSEKKKKEIVEKICNSYATGEYTIESCCGNEGVDEKTFRGWLGKNPEFPELYIKAKEDKKNNHNKKLLNLAETALEKKLKGWEWTEVTTEGVAADEDGEIIGTKVKKVKKTQIPDSAIIIFAITNRDSKNWQNKQNHEHSGEIEIKQITGMTIED
ncbi:MAG: hypothetical protein ACTSXG_03870 [Alphaproteobacteria bacterium]